MTESIIWSHLIARSYFSDSLDGFLKEQNISAEQWWITGDAAEFVIS